METKQIQSILSVYNFLFIKHHSDAIFRNEQPYQPRACYF